MLEIHTVALPVYLESSVIASFMEFYGRVNKLHDFGDLFLMQRKVSLLAKRSVRVQDYVLNRTIHLPPPLNEDRNCTIRTPVQLGEFNNNFPVSVLHSEHFCVLPQCQ